MSPIPWVTQPAHERQLVIIKPNELSTIPMIPQTRPAVAIPFEDVFLALTEQMTATTPLMIESKLINQ